MLRQRGLITAAQARQIGISAAAISRRVDAGRWHRVLQGVYRDALTPHTFEQLALAGQLWAGSDGVIGREAAGALLAFDGLVADRGSTSGHHVR